ncbi:venom carboxylesterase-6-like [Ischnura elegans]|uniref:venom carboxylesterase-6-like n=1 Tax=Ischnura elegans TaxID=197161 RepID=UPI001ED8B26F|nr:venom carboxylesterase-6-like [Ischnura elegans]
MCLNWRRVKEMKTWKSLTTSVVLFAVLLQHLCGAIDEEEFATPSEPVAYCSFGGLRGTAMKSRAGKNFYAFLGIRYGKAGRFEPPVANMETWDGTRDAVADGPSCPQPLNSVTGSTSEDCLYLNVYTPKVVAKGATYAKLPVIIFLHTGAFLVSSGQSSLWGPQYFMDHHCILVTINYRLGPFGFLSTGDSVVPGNMGLKDQVLAMQWVQAYIDCFGGDKNQVTLLGYSAGGASVNFHMVAKPSQHLFHRGISMGGTAFCGWALERSHGGTMARRLAKILNCPHESSQQMVDCMKTKSVDELKNSVIGLRQWEFDPIVALKPVIEPRGSSDNPFLTEEPECTFRSGDFVSKQWITGTTSNEWMNIAATIVQNQTLLQEFDDLFDGIARTAFFYDKDSIYSSRKSLVLKNFYFPHGCITNESLQCITDIYTDGLFMSCADHAVKLVSATNRNNTYYYNFAFKGNYSEMTSQQGYCKQIAAVHNDDLTLLFYRKNTSPLLNDSSLDTINSKKLVQLFYNFARTGNPTPSDGSSGNGLIDFQWIPLTPADLYYLKVNEKFTMKQGYRQERATIWDEVYCRDENHPTCEGPALKYRCASKGR